MKFIIIIAGFIGAGFLSEIKGQKGQAVISMMSGVGNSRKDTVLSVKIGAMQTRLPITVINGRDKGPVFSIVAGVHGYEYPPVIAVQELLKEIKPEHIRGTLIIVPVANMESFLKRTPFVNPLDQKNLNTAFPGSPTGTATDKIADLITREVISNSEIFLDIHGGDANEDLLPFVCYYNRKDKHNQTGLAREMGIKSQIGYVVSYPYNLYPSDPAKYALKQAAQQGLTALSIEAGKLGTVQRENVEMIKTAVYNMLVETGNYIAKRSKQPSIKPVIHLNQQDYVRVPEDGIFYSSLRSGDKVKKKQVLGYITDEFGNKKQDIISDSEGIILYKIGTPPVNKGETLFCIGYNQ
ncbi:succinylglutamate desuccinylase/aspartoacylase family protein [Chryseobacterium kwangjuense]|uniref:Succinylglutamate desuccinylase/aspartoacylase family protein n=1 Tax=Chryseobacterium kwangjuense TaxID=267125 RepID=A0ABW9K5L7_9FLAO